MAHKWPNRLRRYTCLAADGYAWTGSRDRLVLAVKDQLIQSADGEAQINPSADEPGRNLIEDAIDLDRGVVTDQAGDARHESMIDLLRTHAPDEGLLGTGQEAPQRGPTEAPQQTVGQLMVLGGDACQGLGEDLIGQWTGGLADQAVAEHRLVPGCGVWGVGVDSCLGSSLFPPFVLPFQPSRGGPRRLRDNHVPRGINFEGGSGGGASGRRPGTGRAEDRGRRSSPVTKNVHHGLKHRANREAATPQIGRHDRPRRALAEADPRNGQVLKDIADWVQDFALDLHNAALDDVRYADAGIELCRKVLAQFPDEDELFHVNFRADLGEFYAYGARREDVPPDPPRVQVLLESALARPVSNAADYDLQKRLDELRNAREDAAGEDPQIVP